MKISVQRIIRPLNLGEYQPEYGDVTLQTWVNPPSEMTDAQDARLKKVQAFNKELNELDPLAPGVVERVKEIDTALQALGSEIMSWLAEILSQGAPETRMSLDELKELVKSLASDENNSDPQLYYWILSQAWQRILEYRSAKKKK